MGQYLFRVFEYKTSTLSSIGDPTDLHFAYRFPNLIRTDWDWGCLDLALGIIWVGVILKQKLQVIWSYILLGK